ncbi:predicted protein [Plenodomus lingam JN3]|uniref:Uncharacterized protein n=1 Tax=Leptosphaeria maculans (strain JN3 / isolate v23.1.3 / race Av1-4-5-6-7-8) TaxID=985895 RepID=E4ZGQ2_LEPMJ|nr:predicted protein [Plenodomus lingam JN3]CBX90472.1 predicted protein [Plenodomus lingam JN3]
MSLLGYILCPAPRVWLREWRTSPSLLLYLGSTSIVDMVPARRDGPTLRPNMVGHIGMSIQLLETLQVLVVDQELQDEARSR